MTPSTILQPYTAEPVPPYGDPNARIVLVGEAPGDTETARGRPFVGPAGRELDKVLHRAGIVREDLLILNTITVPVRKDKDGDVIHGFFRKTKPPKEEAHLYHNLGGCYVTDEYLLMEQLLHRRLRESPAAVVIPLGKLALFATVRETAINSYRGSILSSPDIPGKKIIPAVHPAAIIHQPLLQHPTVFDFKRANEESQRPDLGLPERQLIINPTYEQSMSYIQDCLAAPLVGFDIETKRTEVKGKFTDWEISCFSLAKDTASAICIPLIKGTKDGPESAMTVPQEVELWKAMTELLSTKRIVTQNGASFDAPFMLKKHKILINQIEDTMVAQGVLTPDLPKDLGFLTSIYTREPYYKADGKKHVRFSMDNTFQLYSARDAAVLMEIFPEQEAMLKEKGFWPVYQSQMNLYLPCMFMGYHGMRVNTDSLAVASEALEKEINRHRQALNIECGREINANSPKDVGDYFYKEKGAQPLLRKGRQTTDAKALKKLSGKGHPEASIMLRIRELVKLKGTYIEIGLDEDQRLRTSFNIITDTGRLSSRQTIFGTGGNMQNLPHDFLPYILADPGHFIVNVDLAQAENRIVAYIAPEPRMMEAFETGIDVHSLTGALISGLSIEEVQEQHKNNVPAPIGAGTKTWRFWGKSSNHALNYGLGPNLFAENLEIEVKDAKWLRDKYYEAYPGIESYHSWVKSELNRSRTLVNPFGRRRLFMDRWGNELFQQAYAQIPQSTVADIINQQGLVPLYFDQETYREATLLNQVHDSIVLELPTSVGFPRCAELLNSLRRSLEQPIHFRSQTWTIPAEFKIGLNGAADYEVEITDDLSRTAENLTTAYAEAIAN